MWLQPKVCFVWTFGTEPQTKRPIKVAHLRCSLRLVVFVNGKFPVTWQVTIGNKTHSQQASTPQQTVHKILQDILSLKVTKTICCRHVTVQDEDVHDIYCCVVLSKLEDEIFTTKCLLLMSLSRVTDMLQFWAGTINKHWLKVQPSSMSSVPHPNRYISAFLFCQTQWLVNVPWYIGIFNADLGSAGPNDMLFHQAGVTPHFYISVPNSKYIIIKVNVLLKYVRCFEKCVWRV